jgi:hypothetical protein
VIARLSRTTALRSIAVLVAVMACRGNDSSNAKARTDSPKSTPANGKVISAGEVVIARPSGRYASVAVASPGSVTGTVTVGSPLQANPPQSTGRDSAVCGGTIPDESVSQQGNGLGGVVVWLEGVRSGKPLPLERRLELESDRCRLAPRVQAAVVASAVNVIGHDDFRQHLRFVAGGESEPRAAVLLGRDEQVIPTELPFKAPGLVIVRDVDHAWPTSYIAVFDHPYFAVTAPNGSFTIDGVPPGKYTLVAWHERTKRAEQSVEVAAGGAAKVDVKLQAK